MKHFLCVLSLLLIFSNLLFSHETPYQPIQKRVDNSEIVFEGEVINSESIWSNDRKAIYTRNTVRIDKIFKGSHTQSTITVYTKGGLTGGKFHMHSHTAFLTKGYKGVFFGIHSPYPHLSNNEFNGIRLLYEESGFIQFTDNNTGIKAVDHHHYYERVETVYDSIYLVTRQPYILKNKDEAFSFLTVPCPPDPEPEITFSYDNIEITGLGQFLEFDIMAKSSQNGTKFGSAELSIKYPIEVFDDDVVQEGLIEVQKEQIIQDNNYTLSLSDISSDEFKIGTSALQNNFSVYTLSTVKEKLYHVKLTISNLNNIGGLKEDDFRTVGEANYYCGKGLYSFNKVNINPFPKVTYDNPNPEVVVGLTYTFENIQIVGNNNDVLSIEIYASSAVPTSFAGGIVEIMFNDDALSFNSSSTGFGFQRGEIIQNSNIYTFEQLNKTAPNIVEIQIESFNVQNLYLLDETPKKFCSIFLDIDDCDESIGLEFLENNMQDGSNHFTGIDPIPWENYDPIIASDTDNSTVCGCTDDPNITDFDPKEIPAGMGQVLTITGTNFGTYNADVCRVIFPDGDEGGASFSQAIAEEGDIINWTDTEIKLYVPSATGGSGSFQQPACSGRFKVVNDCGEDQTGINEILKIPYSVFNVRSSVNEPATLLTIAEVNDDNGVEFSYATNVPTWARNAFEDALAEWCSETNINFTISDVDVNVLEANAGDNLNTITWEDLTIGSGGGQGALVVGTSYFEQCPNPTTGRTGLFMKELDLIIDQDATDQQDVKNVMLHELGHAQMLQHSYDPDASTTNNYLMYFSLTGVNVATIKNDDAIGANMVFSNSTEVLGGSDCETPISQGECGNTNAVNDLLSSNLIKIAPNPNSGTFEMTVSDEINGNAEWKIQTVTGHEIIRGCSILERSPININTKNALASGTYIFTLFTEQGVVTKKLIIHN